MLNRPGSNAFVGLIALSFSATTVAQAIHPSWRATRADLSRFDERDGLVLYDAKPFTGIRVEAFPDGSIAAEIGYVNGLREGESREYGTTGALRAKWRYRSGKKDGLQEGWFIEGPKRFEQNYRDGVPEGVATEWHLNGVVFNRQTYVDGVETARKTLYSTSEVYSNYVKRNGRTFGLNGGELCFEVKKDGER